MGLLEDLGAEHDELDGVLERVTDWEQRTPADGWTIADCIAHLWHFDWRASVAATDPERFTTELAREPELVAASHARRMRWVRGCATHGEVAPGR